MAGKLRAPRDLPDCPEPYFGVGLSQTNLQNIHFRVIGHFRSRLMTRFLARDSPTAKPIRLLGGSGGGKRSGRIFA